MWQDPRWAQLAATASLLYQVSEAGVDLNQVYKLLKAQQNNYLSPAVREPLLHYNSYSNVASHFCPRPRNCVLHVTSSAYPQTSKKLVDNPERQKNIEIMELDQYYTQARFGDWSVRFRNIREIPTKEVEAFFLQFGSIQRVSQTGDSRGLCFVNFREEEAAKRCVEALINNETYRLRRNNEIRIRSDVNVSNTRPATNKGSDDAATRQSNLNSNDESTKKTSEIATNHQSSNSSELIKISSKNTYKMDVPSIVESKNGVQESVPMDLPPLIPKIQSENGNSETGRPPVASSLSPSITPKPMQVITAQEVIVANVPADFGVAFILHLLEKYQPICASAMKVEPVHSLRYCHIYFKTIMDAEAAEAEFDNAGLEKNNLIVLTTNSLAMQAAITA